MPQQYASLSEWLSQAERMAWLDTPLGQDVLVIASFEAEENLGRPFEIRIEALSAEMNIEFDDAIGLAYKVSLLTHGPTTRFFHGILVEAQWLGPREHLYGYRLLLRPWFWLLTRENDCRIFEDMSAVDIITKVFSDSGFHDYESRVTESYPSIDYCVQYRESNFDFVCRMMEQWGIYYFFEHNAEKHTLILADSKSSLKSISGLAQLPFYALSGADQHDDQLVLDWTADRRFRTGKIELKDYDYMKPPAKLQADATGTASYAHGKMEIYDYPGLYTDQGIGDRFAKIQVEAEQCMDKRRYGSGDAPSLFPGGLTTLQNHFKASENIEYVVLGASHSFVAESYRSGATVSPDQPYQGRYEFLAADRPFRMPLLTPRPFVHGPQTAKVTGQDGEEIDVDEEGRILLHYFWERKGQNKYRVRIGQVLSGKKWGGIFIPRIGQEVIVEFLEGNPDRPLVTGTVYNGDNEVPYPLPEDKTINGWKTDSSKGHNGYNELYFDDLAGSELINVHGQKDLKLVIRNSENRQIGIDFTPPMGSPSRDTTLLNGDDNLEIQSGNQNVTIEGSQTTQIQMNQNTEVTMEISTSADVMLTLTVGASTITMTPASVSIESPMIELTAEAEITLEATAEITLMAPIINLIGVVSVEGALTIDGQVPLMI